MDLGADSGFDVADLLNGEHRDVAVILTSTHDEQDFSDLVARQPGQGIPAQTDAHPPRDPRPALRGYRASRYMMTARTRR